MPSLANELCRNGTGYLSMLNKDKVISNFTNENGNITVLVDQDSEFNFTCHNNQNAKNAKKYHFYGGATEVRSEVKNASIFEFKSEREGD